MILINLMIYIKRENNFPIIKFKDNNNFFKYIPINNIHVNNMINNNIKILTLLIIIEIFVIHMVCIHKDVKNKFKINMNKLED
jgi:hypothetical protein